MATTDTQRTRRTAAIHIRATASDQELIDRAAQALGKTRSEFMLDSARAAAEDALLDRVNFPITDEQYRQFEELLDSPAEPNAALRAFVRKRAPWHQG
jgi:uncharacterized protein (DUF1778 family)